MLVHPVKTAPSFAKEGLALGYVNLLSAASYPGSGFRG